MQLGFEQELICVIVSNVRKERAPIVKDGSQPQRPTGRVVAQ